MTSRDFCYWLQGYFEIARKANGRRTIQDDQVAVIEQHLSLVFKHEIDPSMGDEKHQEELNQIHAKIDRVEKVAIDARKTAHSGPPLIRC